MANDSAAMSHPGLLQLYVHLMEMSPTPEKALKAGDVLRTLGSVDIWVSHLFCTLIQASKMEA